MTNYSCPECGKGTVEGTVRKNFQTKVRGYPFVVPEAVIGHCNNCGREFFGANEIKRWTRLYDELLEARCSPLSAKEIAGIRKRLRLRMGGFAQFMGCTRQTVHNWERKDRKVLQLGMADLLLRLVDESCRYGAIDVVSWLKDHARALGAEIEPAVRMREGQPSDAADEEIQFRPLKDYERLFVNQGAPRDLPTLIM